MNISKALSLGCGVAALASLHAAETTRSNGNETIVELDPMVVTASTSEAPLTVTTNPKAPAQPIPAHDGAEVLKTIPGINVIRKGGTDGDPMLRGMAGSRLGIVLDGQCVLGGCGQRMDPPTAYVFPSNYDQVTLLKGPQTVTHGPGQSAGVVLFERAPLTFTEPDTRLDTSLTVGSSGRNDQAVNALAGTPRVYARLSANRSQSDDYKDGSGNRVHSAYERWSTSGAIGWTPDDHTRLELSTIFSDGEAAYADRMMDGAKFARKNVGLNFSRDLSNATLTRVEASVYYNYVDHVMDNYSLRPFTASMMMPNPSVSNPDRETYGGRTQLTLQPTDSLKIEAGLDAQANRHSVRNTSNQTTTPYQSLARGKDARFDQIGVFAEASQQLSDDNRLIFGARLDDWQAQDLRSMVMLGMMGSVANPTASASRHETLPAGFVRWENETGDFTTYAGLGYTERFPDYWELFSKESTGTVSAFNTDAEKTTQLDTGVIYKSGRIHSSVSLFASKINDFILIQSNYVKGMRTATIARNIDATTFGGEATFGYDLGAGWKIDTSLAYVYGTNDTDHLPLAQQPPLEGRIILNYTAEKWSFGALTRLVADQNRFALNQGNIVGQDLGSTGGFVVFSLNVGYALRKNMLLTAGADNLFDTSYAEHISRGGSSVAGFPAPTLRVNEPGRTLWAKLDMKF